MDGRSDTTRAQGIVLSKSAKAVIRLAATGERFGWHELAAVGANASTLTALVKRGLLSRHDNADGSRDWSLTQAGKALDT